MKLEQRKSRRRPRLTAQSPNCKPIRPYRFAEVPNLHTSYSDAANSLAIPPITRSKKRGGAFNRADRISDAIPQGARENIEAAARFASDIGLPLNKFLTLHMEGAGLTELRARQAIADFLQRIRRWIRVKGGQFCYIAVRENGVGEGEHVHLLLHVPPDLFAKFSHRQSGWLCAVGVKRYKGGCFSRPIGNHKNAAQINFAHYLANLQRVVAYVLKATTVGSKGIGPIVGKRCGTSQNIGRAARRVAVCSSLCGLA